MAAVLSMVTYTQFASPMRGNHINNWSLKWESSKFNIEIWSATCLRWISPDTEKGVIKKIFAFKYNSLREYYWIIIITKKIVQNFQFSLMKGWECGICTKYSCHGARFR